jgi:hypothetical protein
MGGRRSNEGMFGYPDFDLTRTGTVSFVVCPVRACFMKLVNIPYGKGFDRSSNPRTKPWCPEHGIRLHAGTFVYWNGSGTQDSSRLRNFMVRRDLAKTIALESGAKAESHRLGYEMSEDALSWNVFVSLAVAGKLRDAVKFLTGRSLRTEPDLYLWGKRIDVHGAEKGTFEPLTRVRHLLEASVRNFNTEPDIMLVVKGEIVICIEAKFGSGNSLAHEALLKDGEKPTSRAGLVERYLGMSERPSTRAAIQSGSIGTRLHSQLFRNIVFASEMAVKEWHVVNLVSGTQHRFGKESARSSYADPTSDVRGYLSPESQSCFTYRTWEDLHAKLIKGKPELRDLDGYMRNKSAHFRPAFELS